MTSLGVIAFNDSGAKSSEWQSQTGAESRETLKEPLRSNYYHPVTKETDYAQIS
jgi:hypothetical protein